MRTYQPRKPETVSRYMSAIRATGGKAEVALRRELHRRGLRFRKNVTSLPGRPDIVFSRARVIVFVDGDYWHGRELRERGLAAVRERLRTPNKGYWVRKLESRVRRDDTVTELLSALGWRVLRYWESDVRVRLEEIGDAVTAAVRGH